MGRYVLLLTICLTLAIIFQVTVATAVMAAPTQICTAPEDQSYPKISGSHIVWVDRQGINGDVYMYDLDTGQETHITQDVESQYGVTIWDDRIVWLEENWWPPVTTIRQYNITTQATINLTNQVSGHPGELHLFDNVVTWEGWVSGTDSNNIFFYDMRTGAITQLTDSGLAHHPDVWGDKIVWYEYRNYQRHDIFMYDVISRIETQITDNGELQKTPTIWGNRIVWVDYRNADGFDESDNSDVYMFDLSTGNERRLTGGNYHYEHPTISGDVVVWNRNNGLTGELRAYDISSGKETTLVKQNALTYFEFFDFDGDNVVYHMHSEESGDDIFMVTLPGNTTFWIVCYTTLLIVACTTFYFVYRTVKKKPGPPSNSEPPTL